MPTSESRPKLIRAVKALQPNLLVKALSGAAVIWTFLPDDGSTASALHHAYRRRVWVDATPVERIVLGVGFMLWAPVTFFMAVALTRRCGGGVKAQTGKGRARQLAEQLRLATTLAVSPPWYYMFELHDDEKRRRAAEYVYRFETKRGLYDLLRRVLPTTEIWRVLSDKARFAEHCAAHGVRAVAALGTVVDGRIRRADGADELPPSDVFLKPLRGAGGRGAERWLLDADGRYHGADDAVLSAADLAEHVRRLSRTEAYVIRALAKPHHAITDLSPGALSTVRVMTVLDEAGEPEVTNAVMRMAVDTRSIVDNFHAGGIGAEVDIRTGRLGRASDMGLRRDTRWQDEHPVTGARITGRVVPGWHDVLELARRAHATLDGYPAVGWDVAILDDGPCLIEGNKSPDLDILQRIGGGPLGNARLDRLLLMHVRRALGEPGDADAISPVAATAAGQPAAAPSAAIDAEAETRA